jgi:predicted Zn-dependent protease
LLLLFALLVCVRVSAQDIAPPSDGEVPRVDVSELQITVVPADAFLPDIFPPVTPARVLKKAPPKYDLSNIGHRGIGKGMNFYSLERERSLGKQLSALADQQLALLDDPVVNEYVNRISQNIALNSDVKVPLTVKVIKQDEVNAFSLPGGYLYLTTGLLNEAGSEAQIAGVIAHEVAHIAARHGTRTVSKGLLWTIILRGAAVAAPGGRAAQIGSMIGADLGSVMILAKMERGAEEEADLLAVEYAYASGYDPGEYVIFFERIRSLQKKKPSALGKIFASHPPTESRISHVQKVIDDYFPDRDQYLVSTSSFEDVQARMKSLLERKLVKREESRDKPVLKKADKN